MRLAFRWWGPDDAVRLDHIRQIPAMTDIVSALHAIPSGEVWTGEAIEQRQEIIGRAGLTWTVVESIPVPESIKLGADDRERASDAWCESLHNVAEAGIPVVCYNFMPVFDWLRTDLALRLDDGSTTLGYVRDDVARFDLAAGFDTFPAWADHYTPAELAGVLAAYRAMDEEALWDHLAWFLERVVPVASEVGVKLGIHPDDPPWGVFGVPRIVRDTDNLRRLLELQPDPANGLTFCTGSLGSDPANDVVAMAEEFADRIHFLHARNVRTWGEQNFHETAHPLGDVDLVGVVSTLVRAGFDGPVRSDHGRMIWGETGRIGYGLYDRALGAMYIKGILDTVSPQQPGA